jgi:hypothetical protein
VVKVFLSTFAGMGYAHINNLYKDTTILMFKEVWALEKIHGTSAHVGWNHERQDVYFFSGGERHDKFVSVFDVENLRALFAEKFPTTNVIVYGEAYGGKQQGMKATYGDILKFAAFDVKVGNVWMNIPNAEAIAKGLGLEFVFYTKTSTSIEALNAERDRPSTQAIRNGCGDDKITEGVVLRPLFEVTLNNGSRIVAKHKRDEFRETKTPREVDPAKMQVLLDAKAIAEEWVTPMRLRHVLDKMPHGTSLEQMRDVIHAMTEDVKREAEGEIVLSKEAIKEIGSLTAKLFKETLKKSLEEA